MAPVIFAQPRPISATVYSNPLGSSMRLTLVAGHRIADRLAAALDHPRHFETGDAALDVDLEFDRRKDRIVDLAQGGGEHLPDGGTWLGILPGENAQQRVTLGRRCALIDDELRLAVALVNRSRPGQHSRMSEAISRSDFSRMSLRSCGLQRTFRYCGT